jgi:hypothetical protein
MAHKCRAKRLEILIQRPESHQSISCGQLVVDFQGLYELDSLWAPDSLKFSIFLWFIVRTFGNPTLKTAPSLLLR